MPEFRILVGREVSLVERIGICEEEKRWCSFALSREYLTGLRQGTYCYSKVGNLVHWTGSTYFRQLGSLGAKKPHLPRQTVPNQRVLVLLASYRIRYFRQRNDGRPFRVRIYSRVSI